jgi:chromosome segregation ATPase
MDLFAGVRGTFANIDKVIGELRNGVSYYNNRVASLTLLQNEILEHAIESEDSITFLMGLNSFLVEELQEVSGRYSEQDASLSSLDETIGIQQESIQGLEAELERVKDAATQEALFMQQYATNQMRTLEGIRGDLNTGNTQLENMEGRLPQLAEKFVNLKRQREERVRDLESKIRRRGNMEESLVALDNQRRQLREYLTAVETLPLPDTMEGDDEVNDYFSSLP